MTKTFYDELRVVLNRGDFRSLRAFYNHHRFSFTYEYLRQIYLGLKVPRGKKVGELAHALHVNLDELEKKARDARLDWKLRRHYRLPADASVGRFNQKVKKFREEGKLEAKILQGIDLLDRDEKQKLVEYIHFLKQQRKRKK